MAFCRSFPNLSMSCGDATDAGWNPPRHARAAVCFATLHSRRHRVSMSGMFHDD